MNDFLCIAADVKLGSNVKLSKFINLYGCEIGDNTKIGSFVEIQKNARVGKNCKISSHTFICEGVLIEDNVFVGHGVKFINDTYPRATSATGVLQTESDWQVEPTVVRAGASIGSGATILSKIAIGERAIVGAGSVVTRSVPPDCIVAGNPARVLRVLSAQAEGCGAKQERSSADLAATRESVVREFLNSSEEAQKPLPIASNTAAAPDKEETRPT